ncbi:phosphodiester glycosidase family protein [Variovorax sp. ZS18.2.2]|uniref:phosphodiester glycosidase family protein n=1 Tax=Variovorax sp. ZS18.2.2 TaxID=2971255 RepID=UPI002150A232|nr:phosphodiester glycosidase family protein [Variovorax sp. ZS18.2.2]MCR6477638.1 phosphodiester glycosidase family protein [Variovorax sp. ZS18.2.2]
MRKLLLLLAVFLANCASVAADPRYTVVKVDLRTEKLALFLNDDTGVAFKRFDRLDAWLKAHGRQLVFAVNAGMYHADFSPVGLFVRDGREEAPLNLASGAGNFFLKPNGVFLVTDDGPRVIESSEYPAFARRGVVQLATQSGPLLLRHGVLHPALIPNSDSRKIRNGVCATGHTAIFVMSETPVNFYDFALYFRDVLRCRDALYLDGTVSALYSKALGRNDFVRELGPILGVVSP